MNFLQKSARKYLRWSKGFSYDIGRNGELALLRKTSTASPSIVLDVGANVGGWTSLARSYYPNAQIHSFEISKTTFGELSQRFVDDQIYCHNFGLSNVNGKVQYKDYGISSGANTLITDSTFHDEKKCPNFFDVEVARGSDFCVAHDIDFIDFLKIDVEGAEHLVLEGFVQLLEKGNVRLIQFEYGYNNGDAHYLMRDFYQFFEQLDYKVGLLRKNGVRFLPWSYELNDFDSGPNFVAIRASDISLATLITE